MRLRKINFRFIVWSFSLADCGHSIEGFLFHSNATKLLLDGYLQLNKLQALKLISQLLRECINIKKLYHHLLDCYE